MIARDSMAQPRSDTDVCEPRNQQPVAGRSPEKQRCVEAERYGAHNQTRGCLLGWNVDVGDFSVASLNDRIPALLALAGASGCSRSGALLSRMGKLHSI